MKAALRHTVGLGLLLSCVAICTVIIAFWPFPSADFAVTTAANATAAQELKDAQAASQLAVQEVQTATQAAAAASPKNPVLDAAVTAKTGALGAAQAAVERATANAKEKAECSQSCGGWNCNDPMDSPNVP